MDETLVVLKDGVLFLGEGIRLERDDEPVGWLRGACQVLELRLGDAGDEIEFIVALPRLFA